MSGAIAAAFMAGVGFTILAGLAFTTWFFKTYKPSESQLMDSLPEEWRKHVDGHD